MGDEFVPYYAYPASQRQPAGRGDDVGPTSRGRGGRCVYVGVKAAAVRELVLSVDSLG